MPFGPFKPVVVFPYVPPAPAPRRVEYRVKLVQPPRQRSRRRPFYFYTRIPRFAPAPGLGPRVKLTQNLNHSLRSQRRAKSSLRLVVLNRLQFTHIELTQSSTASVARRKVTGAGKSKLSPPTVINP